MAEVYTGTSQLLYFCARGDDNGIAHELYHRNSPLSKSEAAHDGEDNATTSSARLNEDIRALLDEDLGTFDEVFVSSQADVFRDRLEMSANTNPVTVLVEFRGTTGGGTDSSSFLKDDQGSYAFLRALSADVRGARYQQHVTIFAVVACDDDSGDGLLIAESCLKAGALDVLRTPLRHEDINRLLGHVKEVTRPPAHMLGAPMASSLVDSIRDTSEPRPATHRPDLVLPEERRALVEKLVRRWHFPAQDLTMDELTYAALFMLEHALRNPELQEYTLPRAKLMAFLLAARRQYKHSQEVFYHNWRHAVDVTQSIFFFMLMANLCPELDGLDHRKTDDNVLERLLTPTDGLILLICAIGHDVGHPGVNNAFLVACNHPLAQLYNDKSVLENYHCAAYSQLLRRHWSSLSRISGIRPAMITTILATDMQRHFEFMARLGELKKKVKDNELSADKWSDKEREPARELLMALLIKAADISNVARPFPVSAGWAKILIGEFARQGELESELAIPTCLFGGPPDKDNVLAAAQSQKGFMDLFGIPLFRGIAEIMPSMSYSVAELETNERMWHDRIERERQKQHVGDEDRNLTFGNATADNVEEAVGKRASEPMAVPAPGSSPMPSSSPEKRVPVMRLEPSPSRHPAHEHRRHLSVGISNDDGKRSSAPQLGQIISPTHSNTDSARRPSKEVALDHLYSLGGVEQQKSSTGSRRGSADATWHMHPNYSGSRRQSKDESLTTILVTSPAASRGRSSSNTSTGKTSRCSPAKTASRRTSIPQTPQPAKAIASSRPSAPSSRSNTTSTATETTMGPQSPSTHPSSLAPDEDTTNDPTPPASRPTISPNTRDSVTSESVTSDRDCSRPVSSIPSGMIDGLPSTPDPPPTMKNAVNTDVNASQTHLSAHKAGGAIGERPLRGMRSRSRLGGLKFWRKRRDAIGVTDGSDANVQHPV